jgi:hypothetical protein
VNNIIRNVVMLPFLIILVASMALGFLYSNSAFGTETDQSSDTSEARSQESSETQSEEGSDTSNTSGTETNQSESATKPFLSGLGDAKVPLPGGKVLDPGNIAPAGPNVQTVVTFNSITVHNNHEGFASGDGEYKLAAYVQGKKVGLTYASGPGSGLMDVSNGETLTFKRSNVAITEIPNNVPLSIFTVGHELDACPNIFDFPDNIQQDLPIFFDPGLDWSSAISKYQNHLNSEWICRSASGNDDEILGTIKEFYDPPGYGVGPHEVKSSNGDFTLRYTINKGDACNASIC